MRHYRLSARVKFSPAAEKLYLEAKNKSEFILEAIEFYANYHEDLKEIKRLREDIEEIKQLLYEIKAKGIAIQPSVADESANEHTEKKEMTDEERRLHENIISTLEAFLGGGDDS